MSMPILTSKDNGNGRGKEHQPAAGDNNFARNVDIEQSGDRSDTLGNCQVALEPPVLTRQESMAIYLLRTIAVSVLVTATILASWSVFRYSRNVEQEDFRTQYVDYASQILASFRSSTERKLWSLEAFSMALTSYSKSLNATWPLVTLPDFQERAESTRDLADASNIAFLPIVFHDEERKNWEHYSIFHHLWLMDRQHDIATSSNSTFEDGTIPSTSSSTEIARHIFYATADMMENVDPGPGPYTPMWQVSPVVNTTQSAVNFNVYRHPFFKQSVAAVLKSHMAVIGKALDIPEGYLINQDPLLSAIVAGVEQSSNVSYHQPLSALYFPVFDSFDNATRRLVGVLKAELFWQSFFTALLPPEVNGIVCVLRNLCGQAYTYQIWGQDVVYLGPGDLHDESYDDWERITDLAALWKSPGQVGLNPNFCKYSLHVFPSDSMRNQYISSKPAIFTSVVVVVFLFTTFVFHVYDRLVERRQKKVMHTAVRSNEIVHSLYPTVVLDRIFRMGSNTGVRRTADHQEQALSRPKAIPGISTIPWINVRIGVHRSSSSPSLGAFGSETVDTPKHRLKNFLTRAAHTIVDDDAEDDLVENNGSGDTLPIATHFPYTTVMYADICGFTAWSSTRDPSQVFTLLESVFRAFDLIAKRHGVFKVETIGDCYVAVAGLPEPQPDHAVIMARFASECLLKMKDVTRRLEVLLGPDTAELSMRFGLHSGPVTAGVLRGEKSRFQLYGNTAHVASKMENSGRRNCIHISQKTADLLCAADKCRWIASQEESVEGGPKTFWLKVPDDSLVMDVKSHCEDCQRDTRCVNCSPYAPSSSDMEVLNCSSESDMWEHASLDLGVSDSDKMQRLIDWNVDVLLTYLKAIVCRRKSGRISTLSPSLSYRLSDANRNRRLSLRRPSKAPVAKITQPIEELTEIISLPRFDSKSAKRLQDPETIDLKQDVVDQLRDYVASVASTYGNHPFHNFEHASHVVLSASKLLKRIVAPNHLDNPQQVSSNDLGRKKSVASDLHDFTYGITSDPVTQFSVVFAALIHDIDHPGVSNAQLIKERSPLAKYYKGKSVAEQNSVDVAWELLQSSKYDELRRCIYDTDDEAKRFRQLLVNLVLATDIFDKELKTLRDNRWAKAFQESCSLEETATPLTWEDANRKATIVIEHIIQASDVAHTMQHWHIYNKWNRRLLTEMYDAYAANRGDKDPSVGWYEGELWFFDNYIIPLAKKLKDCGVFGVASDEYLNFALKNREEWASKGEAVVQTMVAAACKQSMGSDKVT